MGWYDYRWTRIVGREEANVTQQIQIQIELTAQSSQLFPAWFPLLSLFNLATTHCLWSPWRMGTFHSKVSVETGKADSRLNPYCPVAYVEEGDFFFGIQDERFEPFRNGTDFIFLPRPSPTRNELLLVKPGPNNRNEKRHVFVVKTRAIQPK